MKQLLFVILSFLILISYPLRVLAKENSFISVVNPIRGADFWDQKKQKVEDAFFGQMEILNNFNIPTTWLIRFDALENQRIIDTLKNQKDDEKGLFLEVTPSWTKNSSVEYRTSSSWHNAGSAFLSGYELNEREKLIDAVFIKFKEIFGDFPRSVGAWWIDAHSLAYMQKEYGITSALIVADQYSTDNYQIWGQYWSTPYYPSKTHALHPAKSVENKIPVLVTQWPARDPVNGYGNGVIESTYSVQANDHLDYHDLNTAYFSRLLDTYTKQQFNSFNQLVVGLENSYDWSKYKDEYKNQIQVLADKSNKEGLSLMTLSGFANWYQQNFPLISPTQVIVADDPLGSFKKTVWFMNPYYRAGWFVNQDGSVFRDIRQYVDGEEELCFKKRCDNVNFATFATRVLDEVSFGHRWVIDEGRISDFKATKSSDRFTITYKNEAGKERLIEFLPRDINIDGKVSSIDGAILEATNNTLEKREKGVTLEEGSFQWSLFSVFTKSLKFLFFVVLGCVIPGYILINRVAREISFYQKLTLSTTLGFVLLTLLFYGLGILKWQNLIFVYFFLNSLFLIKNYKTFIKLPPFRFKSRFDLGTGLLVLSGIIFQQLPVFKSGLSFPYGLGFWGPNTHDGMWHVSLINQLTKNIPPQNPIYAGESLKNYHFFYDILVAATGFITSIPVLDLVFRFYPIIFSLLLGGGTYYLIQTLFKNTITNSQLKIASLLSLYFVYFAGSFGWIVEFIKDKNLGGESAFWANQAISFNLNPPFAISLIIVITIIQLLSLLTKFNIFYLLVLTILSGSLISFKAYGGILILLSFLLVGLIKRSVLYLTNFITSLIFSSILFFSSFNIGERLIIFAPFWFIHSMIDSPDRVGWVRLSLARVAGIEQGNWFKFISAEIIGFLLFIFGNLGTRLFAFLSFVKIKYIIQHQVYLFIFILFILSLLIPTLFIQAGNPWNTIQFIYYSLYLAALASGVVISRFIRQSKALSLIVILPILIMTPINSRATASGYLGYQPHGLVSVGEVEALNFLKSEQGGVVLTYPYDPKLKEKFEEPWPLFIYDSTAYVSALSGKSSFIEDQPQNEILLTNLTKRIVESKSFFSAQNSYSREFLRRNNIRYIYIPKSFGVSMDEKILNITKIFENKEVLIYEIIK